MMMKTYARIQDGVVAELLTTDGDITAMFNSALVWIDVPPGTDIVTGWNFDGTHFSHPTPPPPASQVHSVADLQAQIATLTAQIATLSKTN